MTEINLEYVEQLANQLPISDQILLAERLTQKKQDGSVAIPERKPRDLYGIWRGAFPQDMDVDAALYEIRHEWEKELEEFKQ